MDNRASYAEALEALRPLAERQHGLLTMQQLRHFGVGGTARRWALDRGLLTEARFTVYVCAGTPASARRDLMAAALTTGPGSWTSHASAAEAHGLSLPRYATRAGIEVTVRRGRMPAIDGIEIHRTLHLARNEVTRVDSVPATSPARTVVDLSGRLGPTALGRLVDDVVLGKQATISEIAAISERLPRAKGRSKKKLRVVLASRADIEQYETQLEQFMFDALRRYDIPLPEPQVWVTACGKPYRLDGFYDRTPPIALEADGWIFRRSRTAFDRDHEKDRHLRNAGFDVHRFTSADTDWAIAADIAQALGLAIPPQPPNGGMTYHEWRRRRDHALA
jgi:hypothetical protein